MKVHPSVARALSVLNCIFAISHAFQPVPNALDHPSAPKSLTSICDASSADIILPTNRRTFIGKAAAVAHAVSIPSAIVSTSSASASAADGLPPITNKVLFDVRISRADGTFYVRDPKINERDGTTIDLSDEPFYGQLVFGLYGTKAPNHVQQFLSYVNAPYDVDNPFPSYSRSRFTTLDISSGLLIGGAIPGLDVTTLAGGNVLEYGGRVLQAKLWIEDRNTAAANGEKISHDRKGLLTHRNLDLTPSFGVTTLANSGSLDSTHTVFGCVLDDTGGFLDRVLDLPVLTESGKVSRTEINADASSGRLDDVGGALASSLFTAQRKVFRDAAKTFGDSRLDKVYDGKLLRRIEVTKVEIVTTNAPSCLIN
eukprot:CCRYP_015599-RD/>CCRYP_015599-RD protein AED:0.07 eAED:0.08 QI:2700/0.75/0.6/1/0.75/0.4/5/0/368